MKLFNNLFKLSKSPVLNFFRGKEIIVYTVTPNVYNIPIENLDDKIIAATKILVCNWDFKDEALSGEAKRHQVYSKLIKIFPEIRRIRLALLIELVISKCV